MEKEILSTELHQRLQLLYKQQNENDHFERGGFKKVSEYKNTLELTIIEYFEKSSLEK